MFSSLDELDLHTRTCEYKDPNIEVKRRERNERKRNRKRKLGDLSESKEAEMEDEADIPNAMDALEDYVHDV